ncbi:MAG: SIS domain-containing protein [Planctomycetota bacterium]
MKNILKEINTRLIEAAETKYLLLSQAEVISEIAIKIISVLKRGNKIILFGNGGSAADAQHIAAEIVGCFSRPKRRALPATVLTANTSTITAIANDYGFENVFSRQVEGLVNKGDVVIALSTSGNSPNVVKGVRAARQRGAFTIGFAGNKKSLLRKSVHLCLSAPSDITARIQECHITVGHIICEMIDKEFK